MEQVRLEIDGMSCGHCIASVERALKGIDGVTPEAVRVGEANVVYDPARADTARIVAAVSEAGFPARLATQSR